MRALSVLLVAASLAPASAPPQPVPDDHDLVLMHPGRPYRIRLHLRYRGKSFQAGWHKQIDRLFTFLDADNDRGLSRAQPGHPPSVAQWQQLTRGRGDIEPDPAPPFDKLSEGGKVVTRAGLSRYYRRSTGGPLQIDWAGLRRVGDP